MTSNPSAHRQFCKLFVARKPSSQPFIVRSSCVGLTCKQPTANSDRRCKRTISSRGYASWNAFPLPTKKQLRVFLFPRFGFKTQNADTKPPV